MKFDYIIGIICDSNLYSKSKMGDTKHFKKATSYAIYTANVLKTECKVAVSMSIIYVLLKFFT